MNDVFISFLSSRRIEVLPTFLNDIIMPLEMKKKESTFLLVSLDDEKAKKLVNVISSDTARKVLDTLTAGSMTETQLAEKLGVPLSTIHYNLKQLAAGGLVETSEFHYSSRGREVTHYSLARKYIIIAPKSDEKLFSKFKNLLPALVGSVGAGFALWTWNKLNSAQPEATGLAKTLSQNAPLAAPPRQPEIISQLTWFFAGIMVLAAFYIVVELFYYFRRK